MLDSPVDLGALRLTSGAGAVLRVAAPAPSFTLGGNDYTSSPDPLEVRIEASRTVGEGWAFKLSFEADVAGPCTRCLAPATHHLEVVAREATRPGGGEELDSPYLEAEELDVEAWARDSALLTLPSSILCESDCPGLCGECGERLAELGPDHAHEKPPDPRWDALRRLSQ
ncbi:MAG: YceD family protein [Actinomycetes bacterium]